MAIVNRDHAGHLARLREAMNEGGTTVTEPLADEFSLEGGGIAWMVRGPHGRLWQVRWEPGTAAQNVRAYRLADGHTGFLGHATDEDGARAEAQRIAGLVAAGKGS